MNTLTEHIKRASIGRIAVYAVAALVIFALVFQSGSSCESRRADKKFVEQEQKHEQERQVWRSDRAGLLTSGAESEKREIEERAKRIQYENLLTALGPKAEALKEKVDNEDQKYIEDMRELGRDVSACERVKRSCAKLGIKPEDCNCN